MTRQTLAAGLALAALFAAGGAISAADAPPTPPRQETFRGGDEDGGAGDPATRPGGSPRMGSTAFPGSAPPPPPPPPPPPTVGQTAPPMNGMGQAETPSDDDAEAADPAEPPAVRSRFLQKLTDPAGLALGSRLPESLSIVTLSGSEKQLVHLLPENRPLVIVFASLSSPTFRDRLGDLRWMRQQLVGKAELMVVYGREQYPAGEWTLRRNTVDDVSIPPHADLKARLELLRRVAASANLAAGGAEFVADAMDDAMLTTLAGDGPHCALLVVRPDATLAARQQWLDPTGVVGLVESAGPEPELDTD